MVTKKTSYNRDRVAQLAHDIIRHKRLYYAGKPEVEDRVYDLIEAELRQLAPSHPALAFVGTDLISEGRKVAHERAMLSLDKTYSLEDLKFWVGDHKVVGMWKIDGNSLSLIYQHGRLTLGKTRGNGLIGEDVTDKIQWVGDILPTLHLDAERAKDTVEIRGELFCSAEAFNQVVREMEQRGLEKPTSARNIVAGMLGRKSHFDLSRYFSFMAFDVEFSGNSRVFSQESAKMQWLKTQGFLLPNPELLKDFAACQEYLERVRASMEENNIGLDGAVFVYDDIVLQHKLGETSHHPRYKMSYKWQGETAVSEVKEISWSTSRLGIVTPVAIIEPVYLSGATITNVTLHNAAMVKTHDLKTGDRIRIVRSGEVIPKFLETIEAAKGHAKLPSKCPSCQSTLVSDDVRLRCVNESDCPAQKTRAILNWIENAEIEDLSEKRLEQMMDLGLVEEIADLYKLTKDDILKLPQTKEKMASKILANITKSRQLPMHRFLCGLGVEGAGRTTWEKLLEVFHGLEGLTTATAQDIANVEGFAEKSALQIANGLKTKRPLINALLKVGVTPQSATAGHKGELRLKGKQIVVTGALSRPRSEIEEAIRSAGGSPGSSVSKNTFAILTDDPKSDSSKMKKARELGITVWDEAEFWRVIGTDED